ncbi:MAG TPA: SRPBCC family protein [Candidatus Sulfopaludibacter sp.]|jgi:uncharacterized protein YndB with AHSA1/START domain|nr:SRPBCC family protein [Candidatus Sulfopaludibacter sp.]
MERTVTHSTFVIERNYPSPLERVYAAFADPARKRRWYAESGGRDLLKFESDFRVGGSEHTLSRFPNASPFPGQTLSSNVNYQDIVEHRRIVMAYTMSIADRRFSASLATIEFLPAQDGTLLIFTDQGAFFEGADGPQMREAGWRKLLDSLAQSLAQ